MSVSRVPHRHTQHTRVLPEYPADTHTIHKCVSRLPHGTHSVHECVSGSLQSHASGTYHTTIFYAFLRLIIWPTGVSVKSDKGREDWVCSTLYSLVAGNKHDQIKVLGVKLYTSERINSRSDSKGTTNLNTKQKHRISLLYLVVRTTILPHIGVRVMKRKCPQPTRYNNCKTTNLSGDNLVQLLSSGERTAPCLWLSGVSSIGSRGIGASCKCRV